MAALKNQKQEAFCFAVAMGTKGSIAARDAGYSHPDVAGSKLLRQPAVRGRIAELGGLIDAQKVKTIIKIAEPTRAWVMAELCENVGKAKEANDRGAVNKGLELVGRELGMFVQRSMVIESPLQRLPADRLLALLALVEEATGFEQVTKAAPRLPEPEPELVTIEGDAAPIEGPDW